jgi:hypothetical protein
MGKFFFFYGSKSSINYAVGCAYLQRRDGGKRIRKEKRKKKNGLT